jgi:hypothetical protein
MFSRAAYPSWGALEKEGDRHLQDLAYVLQLAPVFVFLNLLKRQTERIAELFLGNAQHQSTHANAAPHVLVDNEIDVLCHFQSPNDARSLCATIEAAYVAE